MLNPGIRLAQTIETGAAGDDGEPFVSFLARLHTYGLDYWQADFLVEQQVERWRHTGSLDRDKEQRLRRDLEENLRGRPSWRRIALLLKRRIDDVDYFLDRFLDIDRPSVATSNSLTDPDHDGCDDVAVQLPDFRIAELDQEQAAWARHFNPAFFNEPLETQARRLEERKRYWMKKQRLPEDWRPKGFAESLGRRPDPRVVEAEPFRRHAEWIEAGKPVGPSWNDAVRPSVAVSGMTA